MAPPTYWIENRYTHLVATWRPPLMVDYEAQSPMGSFERRVHSMFLEGQRHLHHEEFGLALSAFRELQGLILKTADPKMPVDPHRQPNRFPKDRALVDVLSGRAAEILKATPVTRLELPPEVTPDASLLPANVRAEMKPVIEGEMRVTSFHAEVSAEVEKGLAAAAREDWRTAVRAFDAALEKTPQEEAAVRASLLHDLAVLSEKAGLRDQALERGQESSRLFATARRPKEQAHALDTLASIHGRGGQAQEAARAAKQADDLRKRNNLHPIALTVPAAEVRPVAHGFLARPEVLAAGPAVTPVVRPGPALPGPVTPRTPAGAAAPQAAGREAELVPTLLGLELLPQEASVKTLTVRGGETSASIALDVRARENVGTFLKTLSETRDVELLTAFWHTPVQMVAYLPHMYFFIVPMAIGDCLAGMGNLEEAEEEYLSVLAYPFINQKVEAVQWWTRVADVALDRGDELYRRGKDDPERWKEAKAEYEKIVRANGTLNANSPLYKDASLGGIRNRVTAFLGEDDPVASRDNPRILTRVLRARAMLRQIDAGLNFFGFAPDYLPPFSFEHLQNTARYFAQNASQIEQQYIQYKSTAENEELRREQVDQQAEVARQTVVLEQRGLIEAQAAMGVAQASIDYAEVQRQNAVQTKLDFDDVRWELLELSELEAWANAASVDQDDEVKLTIKNQQYYNTSKKRRSLVVADLSYRKTRLSHDLEAAKLEREIDSAEAYKGIAEAQLQQARARQGVALQRIQIAQIQQRHAEDNRDFLDMKEFGSRLWYELAREARRLSRRYLDMAIEVAMLMERAYNAETERGLRVIRFDYGSARTADLLAADRLRLDVDHFTFDQLTTVRSKKAPVKKTLSLADAFPMAFQALKTTGRCFFQTELAHFDREHPGLYLCKLRNVELLFVGITGATSIAGSLRNVGVSRFRLENGAVVSRHYPSDVLPLSQYDLRQDTLAFRVTPNDLRLFENSGIETMWRLELPQDANDFDPAEILDVQLVLYYDGLFSPSVETAVRNALPASGSASRGISMRLSFPDELFYLKSQGDAELLFDASMFPRNHRNRVRTDVTLKVGGDPAKVGGLTLRLASEELGEELVLRTDAQGEVHDAAPGRPLRRLRNRPVDDTWTVRLTADDNPGLVADGELDLSGLGDVLVFLEYSFDY